MTEVFKQLEELGFFEWLDDEHNLTDKRDVTPEYLDNLPINDIHRTVLNACVLRFFREKYNLLGCVYSNASGWLWEIHDNIGGTHRCGTDWSGDCKESGMFTSFEKAELECLKKLIEITKSGSLKA
jgi:hypothetical protein